MAGKIKFVPDSAGIQALLKSEEVTNLCESYAHEISSGIDGATINSQPGRYRNVTQISLSGKTTKEQQALLRSLKSGGAK